MSYRDNHYREMCDRPAQYDATIAWIAANNPYAEKSECGAEGFACMVVHDCIRQVIYGEAGSHCSTGMCIAVRLSNTPTRPGYSKVILAITL